MFLWNTNFAFLGISEPDVDLLRLTVFSSLELCLQLFILLVEVLEDALPAFLSLDIFNSVLAALFSQEGL